MKPLFTTLVFVAAAAAAAVAEPALSNAEGAAETSKPAAETAAAPQDLVDAAKANKAKRKNSTTKVLTNADVKKSKAKIVETKVPAAPVVREPTLMEKHVATKAAKADADAKRAATEELIGELEIELSAIEQRYYEENDLNRRDTEIVKRFNDVKKRLDEAKAALAQLP
jgi:hypothetical protein